MADKERFNSQAWIELHYAGEEHRPTRAFPCERCGTIIERWRGQDDLECDCGAWYNSFGQRLRDNWQNNPSNYDEEIGDMEGFEMEMLAYEEARERNSL